MESRNKYYDNTTTQKHEDVCFRFRILYCFFAFLCVHRCFAILGCGAHLEWIFAEIYWR